MDYSLRRTKSHKASRWSSLNPYSNGLLSEFEIKQTINYKKLVLILILMDYSLSMAKEKKNYEERSLNPYSNGLLSENSNSSSSSNDILS